MLEVGVRLLVIFLRVFLEVRDEVILNVLRCIINHAILLQASL